MKIIASHLSGFHSVAYVEPCQNWNSRNPSSILAYYFIAVRLYRHATPLSLHPGPANASASFLYTASKTLSLIPITQLSWSFSDPVEFNIWSTVLTDCVQQFTGSTTCSSWIIRGQISVICSTEVMDGLKAGIRPVWNSQRSRKSTKISCGRYKFRWERLFLKDGSIGPFRIIIILHLVTNVSSLDRRIQMIEAIRKVP